jgi:peptidyl-prolyl cis-trans isomerase C
MSRILILLAINVFLCSTASASQDGENKSTKPPKSTQKPSVRLDPKPKIEPSQRSPAAKPPIPVKLTARDMQIIFKELLPLQKQQQIASDAEEKKKLVGEIKKLLAVAQVADQKGYAEHPDIKSQLLFQQDSDLNNAYRKKNADAKASDEEVNAYHLDHPKDFDDFLRSNPRFMQQAQELNRDELKKQYGEFTVIAARARKEGMERDDATRLQMLLDRAQVLARAYLAELQKDADKLVTAAEVNRYYQDHPADFDELRVRHILISTQPEEEDADENDVNDTKDKKPANKPRALTKEEARKKAQDLLDRVRKGEDFARLAKENSADPGSKDRGGEYDFFRRGMMVAEFENAAFALKTGETSGLVETEFGFHIIKLEARRTAASPSVDQKVRLQITGKLKQEKIEALIAEIADKSPVVVSEDFDTTTKGGAPPQATTKSTGDTPLARTSFKTTRQSRINQT